MATVIDFPPRRAKPPTRVAPEPAPAIRWAEQFRPPRFAKANPRNRYDAAFRGYMSNMARALCRALDRAIGDDDENDRATRDARIRWVIDQIKAIEAEVVRTVPEHHPPAS